MNSWLFKGTHHFSIFNLFCELYLETKYNTYTLTQAVFGLLHSDLKLKCYQPQPEVFKLEKKKILRRKISQDYCHSFIAILSKMLQYLGQQGIAVVVPSWEAGTLETDLDLKDINLQHCAGVNSTKSRYEL